MDDKRLELHEILCEIVNITEPDGDRHTYFQPPESIKIKYPAIVYSRDDIYNRFADDTVYKQSRNYQVTVIDPNPDSEIVEKVSQLPYCRFSRHFKSDNLNHDVFILHY